MDDTPKQIGDSQNRSLPSYWAGWGFLIAAIATKLVGSVIVGSIKDSARGQSWLNIANTLNKAATVQGSFDILMVVFVLIGVILLVRAFLARSRASKS